MESGPTIKKVDSERDDQTAFGTTESANAINPGEDKSHQNFRPPTATHEEITGGFHDHRQGEPPPENLEIPEWMKDIKTPDQE